MKKEQTGGKRNPNHRKNKMLCGLGPFSMLHVEGSYRVEGRLSQCYPAS